MKTKQKGCYFTHKRGKISPNSISVCMVSQTAGIHASHSCLFSSGSVLHVCMLVRASGTYFNMFYMYKCTYKRYEHFPILASTDLHGLVLRVLLLSLDSGFKSRWESNGDNHVMLVSFGHPPHTHTHKQKQKPNKKKDKKPIQNLCKSIENNITSNAEDDSFFGCSYNNCCIAKPFTFVPLLTLEDI